MTRITITAKILTSPPDYKLDTQWMIDLKAAGLSDTGIAAMVHGASEK